ncbi:MAG: hypothetical protein CMI73_04360 [Candidatus Pelagibacter sp.]|nr:hypothetical protein [Candidatus Pelagibacter sp.]OUV86704.1 MAG: hypothetical protein CBC96_04455 [Pelagibacteraceae bacterium TMED136]|tara:strand:- start:30462 stop:30881 length:420 start_codon:yes stop_codon:yes gene_type:complete
MIIECKCKKYKFKIPKDEVSIPGRNVKCEICNEEWFQNFGKEKLKSEDIDVLDQINPSKANINFKTKDNKKDSKLLLYNLIFLVFCFIIYKITIHYKLEILEHYPNLKNYYESLEFVTEIVKSYISFFKEQLNEKFINL